MGTRQAEIKSDLLTAGKILTTNFKYVVPPHQRNFAWTAEEVNQLWDDIIYAIF